MRGSHFASKNINSNVIVSKSTPRTAPVAPAKITDEECAKIYPTNCCIRHKTFGLGVVNKLDDGIITITFEKGGRKELGVGFCIRNKLLEKA